MECTVVKNFALYYMNNQSVSKRFSAAASSYHAASSIQQETAMMLMHYLPQNVKFEQVLDVGCGTGFVSKLVADKIPEAYIDGIDISPAMVIEARQIMNGRSNVSFSVADAYNYHVEKKYDLILSSSALQWVFPMEVSLRNLVSLLLPGGYFVAAVMIKGTFAELHEARKRVAPAKLPSIQLPNGQDILTYLENAGMKIVQSKEKKIHAVYTSGLDFLSNIHNQGVTSGQFSRSKVPLTRSEIRHLITDYETNYGVENDGVMATYRVLYFNAVKPNDF